MTLPTKTLGIVSSITTQIFFFSEQIWEKVPQSSGIDVIGVYHNIFRNKSLLFYFIQLYDSYNVVDQPWVTPYIYITK